MPLSVICGGQFGSEGKGKVAHHVARTQNASVVVRVGGSNSGHTVIDAEGKERKFRSLPTASILPDVICVIAAGSYIDVDVLLREISETGLGPDRVLIDPRAVIITDGHKQEEARSRLKHNIGSTLSGTGAAVTSRLTRDGSTSFVESDDRLAPFVKNTRNFLRECLKRDEKVIIEGTQGFGLSVLHAPDYPNVTSRDTTAAGFVSEVGLSPLDVDEVIMVLRAFPIRVAGNSGSLPDEIDWKTITKESGYTEALVEYTTVTNNVRRVARFHADVVGLAIEANNPNCIVLNHLDYIDSHCRQLNRPTNVVDQFTALVEGEIGRQIDYLGFGPSSVIKNPSHTMRSAYA